MGTNRVSVWLCLSFATFLLVPLSTASAEVAPFEVREYMHDLNVPREVAEENLNVQHRGVRIVDELKAALGDDYAGVWFDLEAGEFVVPLLPDADRAAVAATFAESSLNRDYQTSPAQFSWLQLDTAQEQLNDHLQYYIQAGIVATSIDSGVNAVIIHRAEDAGKAALADIRGGVAVAGDKAQVQVEDVDSFSLETMGCSWENAKACNAPYRAGVGIFGGVGSGGACTGAFKAYGINGGRYVLTAGHCGLAGASWIAGNGNPVFLNGSFVPLGSTEQSKHDSQGDWSKINVTGSAYWDITPWPAAVVVWDTNPAADPGPDPAVNESYPIYGTGSSYKGLWVCHSGITTGSSCGFVTAVDKSVEAKAGGWVHHLTEFGPACGAEGDSGGPVFSGNLAYGIYVGGDGEYPLCQRPNYYYEISRVTSDLGVNVANSPSQSPPTVETKAVSDLTEFQVKLNGTINPNGLATLYRFEYGTTANYGSSAPAPDGNAGSGSTAAEASATVDRLEPGTTYHYRLVATNASGTSYGSDMTFRTPGWRFMRGLSSGSGVSSWEATASMALPSMVSGDFTGDGKADVVSVEFNGNSAYRYRLGASNGSGISSWSTVIDGMSAPTRFALDDFTGDGKADIVAVEEVGGGKYRYMLGISNGSVVSNWSQLPALGEMSYPHKMSLGDFTGDGKADIVAVESAGGGKYRYMLGTSNGSVVSSWAQLPALGEMTYAEFMDLGDFTGDGKADVVAVEAEGGGQYRYMLGTSNGSVVSSWDKVMGKMSGPYFFNVAHFNADGKADIVAVEGVGNGKYRYMLGLSNGSGISSWSKVLGEMSLARGSDLADLTGDGKADVISLETESTGSYSYRLGTSSGTGISSWNLLVSWMRPPSQVDVADFNADGKADILSVESEGTGQHRYVIGTSSSSGTSNWLTVLSKMGSPAATALADFTGDGKADVIALESEGGGKYRYKVGVSTGTGISAWNTVLSGLGLPTRIGVGDFTGDGKADIVAVESAGGGKYRYMLGISNGSVVSNWSQLPALGEMSYPHKMSLGDFTGDGKADIVAVESAGGGKYRYMLGTSNGSVVSSWAQLPALGEMTYAEFMDLADFTGDGKADVASVENEGGGKFRFMLGTSNGTGIASWSKVMGQMAGPYFFNLGDLNGDGKADIVSLEAM